MSITSQEKTALSPSAAAPVIDAPTAWALDDGTYEQSIGSALGGEFIWLNRFTPDPNDLPMFLEQVQVLFPSGAGVDVGDLVDIHIYEDTDGDADPATGARLVQSIMSAPVQAVDGVTWSYFDIPGWAFLGGPGDVLIAVVNRTAGTNIGDSPAALDQGVSQGRSWIGINASATIANPPVLPSSTIWNTIDALGYSGNWLIRASGSPLSSIDTSSVPAMTGLGGAALTIIMGAIGAAVRRKRLKGE
ncbi:MAG: hypothetical protein MI754_10260 [Chromatiales bacterium]|nr:hypothetical protein [Chromatiales bacterium]